MEFERRPRVVREEAGFAAFFDAAPDGMLIHHAGEVIYANPAAAELVRAGASPLVGATLLDYLPRPEDRERVVERLSALAAGKPPGPPIPLQVQRSDGTLKWVEANGRSLEVDGQRMAMTVLRDLTERHEFQRLMHAQRLAAMGAMTAGLAHDLRNPVAGLLANLEYASVRLEDLATYDPLARREVQEAIDDCHTAVLQMRGTLGDMLCYATRAKRGNCRVHELLDSAVNLTRSQLRARGRVIRDFGADIEVHGDKNRLIQVFVNLLMNAAQAMSEDRRSENEVRITTLLRPDARVEVQIADSGHGILEDQLTRIFDRFYSTRPQGEAAGLGLTLSRDIVRAHGGHLSAGNGESGGATFTVLLPCLTPDSLETPPEG